MATGTVKQVREFFNVPERKMGLPEMKTEWIGKDENGIPLTNPNKVLTLEDKDQLLAGLADGTLTY
jgi:hypothetical protein